MEPKLPINDRFLEFCRVQRKWNTSLGGKNRGNKLQIMQFVLNSSGQDAIFARCKDTPLTYSLRTNINMGSKHRLLAMISTMKCPCSIN